MGLFNRNKNKFENPEEELVNKIRKKMGWQGYSIQLNKIVPANNPHWKNEFGVNAEPTDVNLFMPRFGKSPVIERMGQYVMSRPPEEYEITETREFVDNKEPSKTKYRDKRMSILEYGGYLVEWAPDTVFAMRYVIEGMKKLPKYYGKNPELWMLKIPNFDNAENS